MEILWFIRYSTHVSNSSQFIYDKSPKGHLISNRGFTQYDSVLICSRGTGIDQTGSVLLFIQLQRAYTGHVHQMGADRVLRSRAG